MKMLLFSALLVCLSTSSALAADQSTGKTPAEPEPPYPLTTCVVSNEPLGIMGDSVIYYYKAKGQPDRELRFCCERCQGRFENNPAKYLAQLDAAEVDEKPKPGAGSKPADSQPRADSASDHS
ncbi:MAG: hypothetical protein J6386_01120 [Candidatus Synoicihabitans palmerolidicus]|nr:hypothetical protein [Candidatus Synoicihabitans palmerolidicus]